MPAINYSINHIFGFIYVNNNCWLCTSHKVVSKYNKAAISNIVRLTRQVTRQHYSIQFIGDNRTPPSIMHPSITWLRSQHPTFPAPTSPNTTLCLLCGNRYFWPQFKVGISEREHRHLPGLLLELVERPVFLPWLRVCMLIACLVTLSCTLDNFLLFFVHVMFNFVQELRD